MQAHSILQKQKWLVAKSSIVIAYLGHTILVIDSIVIQADKLRHTNLIHE